MGKRLDYDICGGNCAVCDGFKAKDFSCQTVMAKKKVSKKFVPPDMGAIKIMIERDEAGVDLEKMSDAELKKLEEELLGKVKK